MLTFAASFIKYGVRSNEVLEMHNRRDENELLDSLSTSVICVVSFVVSFVSGLCSLSTSLFCGVSSFLLTEVVP